MPEGVAADLVGHEKQTMTYGVYSGGSGLVQLAKAVGALEAAQPTPDPSNVVPLRERERPLRHGPETPTVAAGE